MYSTTKDFMTINVVYPSFDGEVNKFGIGAGTIFVRTQGCHLRCYLRTMNILCDTPEALQKEGGRELTPEDVLMEVIKVTRETGIMKITLTGGDPLYQDEALLNKFFELAGKAQYDITVESSGTISVVPFRHHRHVSFVLDYKLQSAGVSGVQVAKTVNNFQHLDKGDFVKFVVNDVADFEEMEDVVRSIPVARFQWAVGLFWGSKMTNLELFDLLKTHRLLNRCVMNFQTHKLILNPDFTTIVPKLI